MALVLSYRPNMEFKGSSLKTISRYRCKYSTNGCLGFVYAVSNSRLFEVTSRRLNWRWKLETSQHSQMESFTRQRTLAASPSQTMVSNGYVRGETNKNKIYRRLDSCLVIPPPNGMKPRGIIKFLGGAFVGAVPEVTYSHLIYLLAKEGFLIISVPYSVTFDHAQAAREVYERFHSCMDMLLMSGLPYANLTVGDLADLPLYSVGHSNGALLQLLTGSYFAEKIPKANAIISYNNKPAAEAVPYFEQFGPIVSQLMPIVEASPVYAVARSASGGAWKALFDSAEAVVGQYDQEAVVSLSKFIDQLPSVMNQVSCKMPLLTNKVSLIHNLLITLHTNTIYLLGIIFRSLKEYQNSSPHPRRTAIFVKFRFDAIDESDLLEEILRPRAESIGGTLEKVTLAGNHLTPCVQDLKWQVGDVYTPADALAQALKSLSLNDTKMLARTVTDWLKGLENP